MRWLRKNKGYDKYNLSEVIFEIQKGNTSERNRLIKESTPFILKTVSKVCKRYIGIEDDEFSVGIMAFNEAIDKFDYTKGKTFLSFASMVISNKVIDFIRVQAKHTQHSSLDTMSEDGTVEYNKLEADTSMQVYMEQEVSTARKDEIEEYQSKLNCFGMSLDELSNISPKHYDTRKNAVSIAQTLISDEEMKNSLMAKKKLPMSALVSKVEFSHKTVERHRKYIIAIVLLLDSDYKYLQEYLKI